MKLTVRERFDDEMKDDMVRIDDTHRGGIRSGRVCKLTAVYNESDGATRRYIEVKGIGTVSDLIPYLERHPKASQTFNDYRDSIFMDGKTRIRLYVNTDKEYDFEVSKAGLSGNLRYFIAHPDRYLRFLAWITVFALVLAILGYSFKDWYPELRKYFFDGREANWQPVADLNGSCPTTATGPDGKPANMTFEQTGRTVRWLLESKEFSHGFDGTFTSPDTVSGILTRVSRVPTKSEAGETIPAGCDVEGQYEMHVQPLANGKANLTGGGTVTGSRGKPVSRGQPACDQHGGFVFPPPCSPR